MIDMDFSGLHVQHSCALIIKGLHYQAVFIMHVERNAGHPVRLWHGHRRVTTK